MAPTAFVAKRAVAMLSFLWFNYFSKAITTATETVSPLLFQFTYIKTPQLIGIVLGCCVFGTTVVLVFLLLYYSGSFSKLAEELQADATGQPIKPKSVPVSNSAVDTAPELYEELLLARKTVFLQPKIPLLTWEDIELVQFDSNSSIDELYSMCNGSAQFHECEYPPASLWDWLDTTVEQGESIFPYRSLDNFKSFYCKKWYNGCHVIIFDNGYRKGIGMISLVDNHPNNLSIRLANLWITPAFRHKKYVQKSVVLLLSWLFNSGYRRITAEVDQRNYIAKKFFLSCGFLLESTLRKHRIVNNRNSDSSLFVLLNNEWREKELGIRRNLKMVPKKTVKASEIADIQQDLKEIQQLRSKKKNKKRKKH